MLELATQNKPLDTEHTESPEVETLLLEHDLRADFDTACAIAKQAFPTGCLLHSRVQFVPDLDCEQIVVGVTATTSVETALLCQQQLLNRWTQELSLRAQEFITFTLTLQ